MISRVGFAIYATCLVCAWLCCVTPAYGEPDPLPEIILTQQRMYFQSITSLRLDQVATITVNEALRRSQKKSSTTEKQEGLIVVDGARYFSEVKLDSGAILKSAFNGSDYQTYSDRMLIVSKSPPHTNPYLGWTVLTAPFCFAFGDADELSINALRNPELWARRLKELVSVSKAAMLGHEGTLLEFASPDDPEKAIEAFFAKDLGQLPIYVKLTFKDTISEMTVLDSTTVSTNGLSLVIPTRVSAKDYSLDKAYEQECVLEANTKTLQVNQPVSQDQFTLPHTNVKAINYADFDLLVPMSESK